MKTIGRVVRPLDSRQRTSFLLCLVFVALFPILASINAQKNDHANTYARKSDPNQEFAKNHKESEASATDDESSDPKVKSAADHRNGQSIKGSDENSPALGKFLEDVLKAQNDLKWIDQAVRNVNREKDSEKSSHGGNKLREKRGSDRNYGSVSETNKNMYRDESSPNFRQRMYSNNEVTLKMDVDLDDLDASQNGKDIRSSPFYDKGSSYDRIPKDWTKTKDLCSLSDWVNSNRNSETEQDKSGDRWIHAYEANKNTGLDSPDFKEANANADASRLNARNQRDETKENAPSLESLRETILELKKSLNEADKKQRENSKIVAAAKVEGEKEEDRVQEQKERRTRAKNKQGKNENDDRAGSGWWENPDPERLDLKKREQASEDLDEKNARLKVWRTKRTEVNNGDGNPKLFHRAGFGEPYLEQNTLKELHDRKRRSKGAPSDEKRHLNEAPDKNNSPADEKNSIKISKPATGCNDLHFSDKKQSSDLRRASDPEQADQRDTANSNVSSNTRSRNTDAGENYEQSDLSRGNLNAMEKKLTQKEEKGESPEGNSLRTFESMTNELQRAAAASSTETSSLSTDGREEAAREARMQKTEENRENVGSGKGEQVIKVFEPQGHLYQNGERTKEVRRTEPDEEAGKLSRQLAQEKTPPKESANINILVKSENKNLIELSNAAGDQGSFKGKRTPFVLNMFNTKRKLILENEDKPGESVSTVFNVKIEKAQLDAPVTATNKREEKQRGDDIPFGSGLLDSGKNEVKEVPYEDTPGSTNNPEERNASEKRLKNSEEFDKGSEQSGANEKGTRNWFEGAVRDRMGTNVDQSAVEKCNEFAEGDNYDKGKADLTQGSNGKTEPSEASDERKNKKKYHEIFLMANGMNDRVEEKYGQRRILQYMEYSNDDVEDADLNYSDKEEEDNQRQATAEKSDAPARRKERSAYSEKKKAKVNLLIKEKLDRKKNPNRGRKRRNPSVIEYYDYDSDAEQQDHESLSPSSEQERSKNNYQEKNAIDSDAGLAGNEGNEESGETCVPPFPGKTEHEEAVEKEQKRKEKMKYQGPKEQFLGPATIIKNETEQSAKPDSLSASSAKVNLAEEEGSSNQQPGSRLNQQMEANEDKFLDSDTKEMVLDPTKYIPNVDKNFDFDAIDDIFEDARSMDEKKEKGSNSVEPLYEELKKIYDWSGDETKGKARIKGDQRMYYAANDKLDPTDRIGESFKDQVKVPEIHGPAESSASSPNLSPLLLIYNGSGKSEIGERTYSAVSSGQLESPASSNVSQSNYFALKSTDDMFKGGSEQSNSSSSGSGEEKLRGPSTIGTVAEWRTQKVSGVRNGAVPEKDAASWSLTDQRQYIDTDSRSPYENRKYLQPRLPRGRERVQNIDPQRQTVISSRDLHESFVEPLEWIDDFDKELRVRLSRSLKTVEANTIAYVESNAANSGENLVNGSIEAVRIVDHSGTQKSDESNVALVARPSLDLQQLFRNNIRLKRDADAYDTLYDDTNQDHDDSENIDYPRYSKKDEKMDEDLRVSNTYEDTDDAPEKISNSDKKVEEYDFPEDEEDDYDKVARSASPKRKKKHGNKKKELKKQKRKGHGKSRKSRRKRRHRKKHSSDSKTKKHNKKHKKSSSKSSGSHTNVKKSKASQNQEKTRGEKKERRDKVKKENTNADSDTQGRRIFSLLSADNIEDESQMGSALHGELAGKIVEQIFDQVQKNEVLKVSLGPGLYQKHKTRDTVAADKSYRQAINDDEIKHTEELLNKIMLLLNRLIFDEVQRKTCISLPPDLIEFLDWMLDVNPQESLMEQPPTLPLINGGEKQESFPRDKFLFQSFPNEETEAEISELYAKIRLIKGLIKEYSALTEEDKGKIESIQDYLAKQLDLLLEYVEAKEDAEKKGKSSPRIGAAKGKGGSILQYQIGMSNTSNASYSARPDTFSPLMNAPNLLKLNNPNFPLADEQLFRENRIEVPHRGQRIIRSLGKHAKRNKKQRKRKKRKRKHGKHHKGASSIDQSPHKDSVHKVAALRRKREYLDKVFWDPFDSGYEEPLIYTSMDMKNVESNANGQSASKKGESLDDKGDTNAGPWKEKTADDLKSDNAIDTEKSTKAEEDSLEEEEPITGNSRLEDEILLLNKRQAWKMENEQQLEEVAFGEDMRKASKDKELFEKLTEIDKKRTESNETRALKNDSSLNDATNTRNKSSDLSDEDRLRMLEAKINVYADNE